MLEFFTGAFGKIVGMGILAACLAGGATYAIHTYNSLIEARLTVAEQSSTMAAMQKDRDRTVQALQAVAVEATARFLDMQAIRKDIDNATETNSCGNSPAIRAVNAGMRSPGASRNPGSAPANTK